MNVVVSPSQQIRQLRRLPEISTDEQGTQIQAIWSIDTHAVSVDKSSKIQQVNQSQGCKHRRQSSKLMKGACRKLAIFNNNNKNNDARHLVQGSRMFLWFAFILIASTQVAEGLDCR